MFNIIIFILALLILISINILLINEESLILLCFIFFVYLVYNKLNSSVRFALDYRALNIQKSIKSSFDSTLTSLRSEFYTQNEIKSIVETFYGIKSHFVKLNTFVALNLNEFILNKYQKSYRKKLVFTQRLENQTSKLLALLLVKKISKITNLNQYYLQNFHLGGWKCIYKISLREHFEII
uniref:ATP synthase B chain n=1 Tax=Gelidium vagum TaxID=35171 RepID=V5JG54_GELVA|nr:ATP synthase B chain precursor [Gelidium vagum]AGO19313.1 ATP synthase B chain precursor [Gelidium vagum]